MFAKVEGEKLSVLRQNQSKLRESDCKYLYELLSDGSINRNEVVVPTKTTNENFEKGIR